MNPRPMRFDPTAMTTGGCVATASPDVLSGTNCLAEFIKTTDVNLTRANEIVSTIISRIEGSGSKDQEKGLPSSHSLMNVAADCSRSSADLNQNLDYLAKLLTGGC